MSYSNAPLVRRGNRERRKISPDIFKWSDEFVRGMGWQSKRGAQNQMRTEMAGQLLKMEQDSFKQGETDQLRNLDRKAGSHWKRYLADRLNMERTPPPRMGKVVEQLRKSAQGYIDHFENDYNRTEKADPTNIQKRDECLKTLNELRKLELRDQFVGLGDPPWDSKKGMKAASLKASLDMESLPGGQCSKLDSDNVNPAFWVKKQDQNGSARTYLFKPGGKFKGDLGGFPPGGEPMREAMTGRASDLLGAMSGIDFRMPETNVVEVGTDRFPQGDIDPKESTVNGDKVMGSLQQYAQTEGELRDLPREVMRNITPESCQTIAVLDTITLNLDRHSGNLMINGAKTKTPSVVPIDHGLSFPTSEGLPDIAGNLGNDKNVLLKLPGSWQPFDKAMLEKIDKIDPDTYGEALKKERDDIDSLVPGSGGKMPDESITMSRRSAMFLKKAAGQLPPALLQIALGQHSLEVLDPTIDDQEFDRRATKAIQDTLGQSAEFKEYFLLMNDEERLAMRDQLVRYGWPNVKTRLNERWMMTNLKLALNAYKNNTVNPVVEREILQSMDRNTLQNRLAQKEPIDGILVQVRGEIAKTARPIDLDEDSLGSARNCLRAFPQMKLTIPPVTEGDTTSVRSAIADWRNFNSRGGMNALKQAITDLCLTGSDATHPFTDARQAVITLEQAERVQTLPPPQTDKFDQKAKERTLDFMETLVPLLPRDDQGDMTRRIRGIRLNLAVAMDLNTGQDLTDRFKGEIAVLKDELIEDVSKSLRESLDYCIAYMKNQLHMQDDEIGGSASGIKTQIRAGNVRAAGDALDSLKRSYSIP